MSLETITREILREPYRLPERPAYRDPYPYTPPPATPQQQQVSLTAIASSDKPSTIFQQHDGLQAWTEYTIDVAQRIDSGLAARPLYVARMQMNNLRGASGPGLFRTFEREIKAAGKEFGPGPTVVADSAAKYEGHFSAATAAGLDTDTADAYAKRNVSGLLLHEFGHGIANNEDGTEPPIGGDAELARVGFEQWANSPPRPEHANVNPETQVPFAKHDAPFLRTISHLWARARQHIPGLQPDHLISSDLYGLSPIQKYVDALQPELSANESIEQVVFFTRPPEPFIALWRSDITKWFGGIAEPTQHS